MKNRKNLFPFFSFCSLTAAASKKDAPARVPQRRLVCPKGNAYERTPQAEKSRVQSEVTAMSDDEKSQLIKLNENLSEWQNIPDSEENTAKLPKLPLTEISTEPIRYITEEKSENEIKILTHPVTESEITVMTLYFDADDLSAEELRKLSVIDRLIAELPTKKSDGVELQKRIEGTLGSLTTDILPVGKENSPENCRVFFELKTRFLSRNFDKATALISEILTETDFVQPELALREMRQDEENMKQDIISDGHRFSVRRTTALMSAESALIEFIRGYEAYRTFHSVNELSDEEFSALLRQLKPIAQRIFCKSRLTVSIGSALETNIGILTDILPEGEPCTAESMKFSLDLSKNTGITIPSATCCSGAVLGRKISDKSAWSVASTIISYEYLWNEVRVKGGAYGSGCSLNNMLEVSFYSYCDPSPMNSIGIYENSSEFLREYCRNNPDITSYIISTIASGEPLVSDAEYASAADSMYFRGITQESRRKLRGEILSMSCDRLADICDDMKNPVYSCVTGSDDVTNEAADRGFKILSVF